MRKLFTDEDVLYGESYVREGVILRRSLFSGSFNVRRPISWVSETSSGSLYSIVYDKDPSRIEANKICTFAYGHTVSSSYYNTSDSNNKEKVRMYRMYAQKLLGAAPSVFRWANQPQHEAFFFSIGRNIAKDGVNLEDSFELSFIFEGMHDASPASLQRFSVSNRTQSFPGGEGCFIKNENNEECGILFSESSTLVLGAKYFGAAGNGAEFWSGSANFDSIASGTTGQYDDILYGIENRINYLSMSNFSKVRNTIYQCKVGKEEFNYSSNPTFVDRSGQIVSTSGSFKDVGTQTFITTIGLVDKNGQVIAVGKLSRPVKNTPDTDLVINVKLDY